MEPTIEELKLELEKAKAEMANLTATNNEQASKITSVTNENDELKQAYGELQKENKDLWKENKDLWNDNAELENLRGENAELKAAVTNKPTTLIAVKGKQHPQIPAETVKVDGREYKFKVASFHRPGYAAIVTAEQALTDDKLLESIIAIKGQRILQEIL